MKTALTLLLLLMMLGIKAQSNLQIRIHHEFNGEPFSYNQSFLNHDGKMVSFTRLQYYLSGITLIHDGGQNTALSQPYLLASANITNYDQGTVNAINVEGIKFDLGVDATSNGMGTSSWSNGHPLSAQSPSMDWGWPSGYFFWAVDGAIDDSDDGNPNKLFAFHGIGNSLLRNVTQLNTTVSSQNGTITIDIFCNIADWFQEMDLVTAGFNHNGNSLNAKIGNNTNDHTVFTTQSSLGLESVQKTNIESISVDLTIPYAPTLYYHFDGRKNVNLSVFDLNGKEVLAENNLANEGNFFILKELPAGNYIARFYDGSWQSSAVFPVVK